MLVALKMAITVLVCILVMFHNCFSDDVQKRIVLHSELDLDQEFKALRSQLDLLNRTQENKIKQLENEIKRLEQNQTHNAILQSKLDGLNISQENKIQQLEAKVMHLEQSRGSTYVRWGKTTCGGNGTHKVYSGYAAGSDYNSKGSAVNYICLPDQPSWGKYVDGYDGFGGVVKSGEYEFTNTKSNAVFGKPLRDEDPPCVVCKTPRPTTMMVPARTQCYPGWTLEYTGYLMSGNKAAEAATEYVCVDSNPEALFHGEANTNGKLFLFVEILCGGLPCQLYPAGRELACVVCSQ